MRLAITIFVTVASGIAFAEPRHERTVIGMDSEVHAVWTRIPLRTWTARAAALAGRPVVLDRRIDPDLPITMTARGESLRTILARVASDANAAVDELESTIRIVPLSMAGQASRADADRRLRVAKAPASVRRRLTATDPWTWPAASQPRALVADLVQESGLDVEGIDSIPHDHFPAAELPALSMAERLDLVLAHFDRRVLWSGSAGKPAGQIVAIDAEILPAARAERLPRARPKTGLPGRTVTVRDEYTLKLEAPLDQALHAITRQLDLELEFDVAALKARGIAAGEIVRAHVVKASRDELLDAILKPLGLVWQVKGKRLHVSAGETRD